MTGKKTIDAARRTTGGLTGGTRAHAATEKVDRDGRPIHRHRASFARATDDSRGPVRRLLLALRV